MRKCVFAFVVLCLVPTVYAQEGAGGRGTPFIRLAGVEGETVKGAPYSADVISESVQTLTDGNRIVHRTTSRIYRDSEGRTRRETDRPVVMEVAITDPVAEKSWSLNVENHTARQNPLPVRLFSRGTLDTELSRLTLQLNGVPGTVTISGGAATWLVPPGANEQRTEEKLAPRTIEGLRVEGIRRAATIAAGAIGNERPIVVTSEEWMSPDLKVLVLSESNDPRSGTSTYKLVNVKRGDPPASLFQVPSDYTVVQGPAGGRGGRGVPETPGGARGRQ
jgi:hypothetical protein